MSNISNHLIHLIYISNKYIEIVKKKSNDNYKLFE